MSVREDLRLLTSPDPALRRPGLGGVSQRAARSRRRELLARAERRAFWLAVAAVALVLLLAATYHP
jgi:hypothetical protein